ncbi:MAG TPA: hypothetical protein VK760_01135 [Candidatus Acidoferrales bacterium]|jgi:hypothetical protein|nr:hypothetical protein [Candidatus Acidoferrales bacterium]
MERRIGCAVLAFSLAACNGSSSGSIPRVQALSTMSQTHDNANAESDARKRHKKKVRVKFRIHVPNHKKFHNRRVRRRMTVSENTKGVKIVAYLSTDTSRSNPLGSVTANISPTACPPGTNDARACPVSLEAPPDAAGIDFVVKTYDAPPNGSGNIPSGANELGVGASLNNVFTAGNPPPIINLTLDSVIAQLGIAITPASLHTLIPSKATISVYGLDADDDVIVSNGFIDAGGNNVSVGISPDNSLNGMLSLSTTSLSAPSPTGIVATYAGNYQGSGTTTVTFTASASGLSNATAKLTAVDPVFTMISDPNLNANNNNYHGGIVFDSNGGAYYSFPGGAGNGGVSYYDGSSLTSNLGSPPDPILGGIAGGPSTFYAIPGNQASSFGAGSPAWTPLPSASAAPLPAGSAMVLSGNKLWYTNGSNLASFDILMGNAATYPFAYGRIATAGVTLDSSGNVWAIYNPFNEMHEFVASSGYSDNEFGLPNCDAFDDLDNVNSGGSEYIFVTQRNCGNILQLDTNGNVVNTITPTIGGSGINPTYMMSDNAQPGIIWFDYQYNGHIGIGRLNANDGNLTYSLATASNDNCCANAGAIGTASNGLVYMVDDDTQQLVQVAR